jgi:tetratricopeptide (TPR) repeat protein
MMFRAIDVLNSSALGNALERYMAATQNRLAVAFIEKGDGEAALQALQRAEEYAESVPKHQDQLMTQTICEIPEPHVSAITAFDGHMFSLLRRTDTFAQDLSLLTRACASLPRFPAPSCAPGNRASAYARLEQNDKAIEHFHVALDRAHATGDESLAADINQRLVRTAKQHQDEQPRPPFPPFNSAHSRGLSTPSFRVSERAGPAILKSLLPVCRASLRSPLRLCL